MYPVVAPVHDNGRGAHVLNARHALCEAGRREREDPEAQFRGIGHNRRLFAADEHLQHTVERCDGLAIVDAFSDDEVLGAQEKCLHDGKTLMKRGSSLTVDETEDGRSSSQDDCCEIGSDTDIEHTWMSPDEFVDLTTTRGLMMRYILRGPEDAPKLLYIPGATDDLRKGFTTYNVDLFAQNFRTLTCDMRSQGQTEPFAVDEYVAQEIYVDDLIALVDAVYGPEYTILVAGWSSGAILGVALARAYPSRVSRLAVLAGGYIEPHLERHRSFQELLRPKRIFSETSGHG